MAAMRFTQERWIRHERDVHTQIVANLRRLADDRRLEFSSFPVFLEDVFHVLGGAGKPATDDDDGGDDGGDNDAD